MISWLAQSALDRPERLAIVAGDVALTYSQLADEAQRRAAALRELGITPRAIIGLHTAPDSENSLEWICTAHAIFWLGATLVPLHSRATHSELTFQLTKIPLDLLITGPGSSLISNISNISSPGSPRTVSTTELRTPPDTTCEPAQISDDDILTILFTSGTTGQPKAVPLTVANHFASALASRQRLHTDAHQPDFDRWLCCLPLCHVGGLAILLRSAIYATCVELTSGFDPNHVLHLLQTRPITLASLVPTMLYRLLDAADRQNIQHITSNLRAILIGGGSIDPELLRAARRRGLPVVPTYGMTEASTQITTLAPSTDTNPATDHLDTAGRPLDGFEIRIVLPDNSGDDAFSNYIACQPDQIGTILVRGPMLTRGYIGSTDNNPQDDRFQNGWYKTGDMGRLDHDGYLTIEHRHGDLIVTGGENVDPNEVERTLRQLDSIKDVAIVGIDHPEWGQAVAAAIVCTTSPDNPDALLQSITQHCRTQLARFKVPRNWKFVTEIPRTASGKVLKEQTRLLFSNP